MNTHKRDDLQLSIHRGGAYIQRLTRHYSVPNIELAIDEDEFDWFIGALMNIRDAAKRLKEVDALVERSNQNFYRELLYG